MTATFLIYLFLFAGKIFFVKTAGVELGAATAAVGAHRLKSAYEFGALFFHKANDLSHNRASFGSCLHA